MSKFSAVLAGVLYGATGCVGFSAAQDAGLFPLQKSQVLLAEVVRSGGGDQGDPQAFYRWNGTDCRNNAGQAGLTPLHSNIPSVDRAVWQGLLINKDGECLNLQVSSDLTNMDLQNMDFKGSYMYQVKLTGDRLDGASFAGAMMKGAVLDGSTGLNVSFSGAATMEQASLVGTQFMQSDFTGIRFYQAVLRGGNFIKSNFSKADFSQADASAADFNGAVFMGANLREAKLAGANLGAARLIGADFRDADLSRADLRCADMSQASTDGTDLQGALYDRCTILPPDIDPFSGAAARGMVYVRDPNKPGVP